MSYKSRHCSNVPIHNQHESLIIAKTVLCSSTMSETYISPTRCGISSLFARWAPRPVIASMLNNKGVILTQQHRYAQARRSFYRALRFMERDSNQFRKRIPIATALDSSSDEDSSTDSTTGTGSLTTSASVTTVVHLVRPSKPRVEYDEGMDQYPNLLRLNDIWHQDVDATLLFNLGRLSHNQGNYDMALDYYKLSLQAIKSNDRLSLVVSFSMGHCHYCQGDMTSALLSYRSALSIAKSLLDKCDHAACLNAIGVVYYAISAGKLDEALEAFRTSLELRQQHMGEHHPDVGTTWNNMGRLYYIQGKYPEALHAYEQALRIRRHNNKDVLDTVDVAATLVNIGQVYNQMEDYQPALVFYKDFLRLAKIHFGEYHRDVCIVTTCIGQVLQSLSHFEQALKVYQDALRIGEAVFGTMHSEIAIIFNKIGNLHYETQDFDSALKAYHQGLEVEMQVLDAENSNILVTYSNIAEIHKQRADFDLALHCYDMILQRQRSAGFLTTEGAIELATTLSNIAYVHHQRGDYDLALEVNQECLHIRREQMGDMTEDVASSLFQIALVLLKMDRSTLALQAMLEAYQIRKKLGQENRELASAMYNVALIYHQLGSSESALAYYIGTARIEEKLLGKSHRDLSITFFNMAQIYYQRGDMELALQKFRQALAIERECFGTHHATCARTLNEIGNIELQLGNLSGLMEAYGEAFRIQCEVDIEEDVMVVYGVQLWRFERVQPLGAAAA